MTLRNALVCMAASAVLLVGIAQPCVAVSRRRLAAMVVSPKRGDRVQRSSTIIGRALIPGQPLVLVRPVEGDRHWWVQPPVEIGERGYFRASVRFGNSRVPSGSQFVLLVLVLRNQRELDYFMERESLAELPAGVLQSEPIRVVLSDPESSEAGPLRASILKPQANGRVNRSDELIGKVSAPSRPIILVRSGDPNSLWWVQDEAILGRGGYFKASVRFGNDSTPLGSRFEALVVIPRSEKEAKLFSAGATFARLPDGIPRSRTVAVVLQPAVEGG